MSLAQTLSKYFRISNSIGTFTGIIKAMMLGQKIHYRQLAEEIRGNIKLDSKAKSVFRFLTKPAIDDESYLRFIKDHIPKGKSIIAVDRTTWEMGDIIRNVYVLSASVATHNIGIPALFRLIVRKGAINGKTQISLIKSFIQKFGRESIGVVLGDREFNGFEFINFMIKNKIPFVVRIKKSDCIEQDGDFIKITNLTNTNKTIRGKLVKFRGCTAKFSHLKLNSGEYLSLISSTDIADPIAVYKQRWDIERSFKFCKSSHFNLEASHVTNKVRFTNLLKCMFIAYALMMDIGKMISKVFTIPIKKTLKCKAYSIMHLAADAIKELKGCCDKDFMLVDFIADRSRAGNGWRVVCV